jgi:ectoine hydroxylase-related dioxygenase (phytanoyl-CoA dioxygenase family)
MSKGGVMPSSPTFGDVGYHFAEAMLGADELNELRAVVEHVVAEVAERARRAGAGPEHRLGDGHRIQFSSHTAIQWEWSEGSQQIRLLEPVDHLHPRLADLFIDVRLTGPVQTALGTPHLGPFTSKLNLKRAHEGSGFPWHQDYPYWYVAAGPAAADVVTAIVFLDDATTANGAVRVLPGSHLRGPARRDPHDPTRFLADPTALNKDEEVVIEAPAGSVLWFGPFLVHRSSPNTSGDHRRALLPSWQPAGRPRLHALDYRRELVEELP